MQRDDANICSIIVTYQPDENSLTKLVASIIPSVNSVVIVDNGSTCDIKNWLSECSQEKIHIKLLDENLGIAAAQNVGIGIARSLRATHILLLDQDSTPAEDMVIRLLRACQQKTEEGYRVAAVGPYHIDAQLATGAPFSRMEGFKLVRCSTADGSVAMVDYLISSGSLIPLDTIDIVGGMREDFFIDYVDIEWGLRAKKYGFQSFGDFHALMSHRLGDPPIQKLGRTVSVHSPLRHYYRFRNATWLYMQNWPPKAWKFVDARRLLLKFCFYSLFAKPRLQHLKMMCLGVMHGICGRMGPFKGSYKVSISQ